MTRPAPLRTDGSNAFARFSMQVRVPKIARDVLPGLRGAARDAVERLAAEIEGDAPLPAPRGPAPDLAAWGLAHAEHAHETWLGTEWFFAELAFYRELAHRCRYWETGADPFEGAKEAELAGDRPWDRLGATLASVAGLARGERLAAWLDASLWGNRVDLSYAVAAGRTRADDDLLVDDRALAAARLTAGGPVDLHVVADNTGPELALDLGFVDAVLEDARARVTLHLKHQPVFVSDALPKDVWRMLARMRERGGDLRPLAERLVGAFDAQRLALAPDPFWSGPRFLWDAPAQVLGALWAATLVVFKGDANYRRVLGDAAWPPTTPFAEGVSYLGAPLVCLRTMKSDPVLGLGEGVAERLDASEPRWRIEGRYGVAQAFVPP